MTFSHTTSRAFTLIELLVVISIIGMLSSVVLVSLSSARDKGRVGAGLTFAGHTYRAFGADALVYMDFNGNYLNQSGYGFSNTNTPGGTPSSMSPTNSGSSYLASNSGEGVQVALSSPMTSSVSSFTAAAWVYPTTDTGGFIMISDTSTNCGGWGNRLVSLYRHSDGRVQIAVNNAGGGSQWNELSVNYLPKNKWTHIAYSYAGGTSYSLYIDGKKVASPPLSASTVTSLSCMRIGYINGASDNFTGNIDDVAIYTQSLAASDIEHIYAQGLPNHTLAQVK